MKCQLQYEGCTDQGERYYLDEDTEIVACPPCTDQLLSDRAQFEEPK